MDFSWNDEQLEYKQTAIEFAQRNLTSAMLERDQHEQFSPELWQACAEFGVLGLPFAEEYGGAEVDILTTMLMMEGLGYACRDHGLLFGLNAQMWSVQHPIALLGSDKQQATYLPRLIKGEIIGAHGMTEPDSGSDAYSLRTRAEKQADGGYILNGSKTFVTNAPIADMVVVFATTNPAKKSWGITAFVVDVGTTGFQVGQPISKMGLRTSPMGELIFEDCYLPAENRLGKEGQGAYIFNSSMEWERSCILATHIGAMEHQLEQSIQYAKERKQFGQPIGKFQSISNRIADMKVRLETARLLLYKVAWLKKQGKSATVEAAMAKLYLSEAYVQSSMDAIRIYGGYGYTAEFEVERNLRDAVGGTLYSGTSDIQRNIIASMVGL